MLYRKGLKKCVDLFVKPLLLFYLKKQRSYHYKGIPLIVYPGVFHPGFFFSTRLLLSVIEKFDLKNKSLLELGAGSGLISFYSAKKGAKVIASDISPIAIAGLIKNRERLNLQVEIIESDLFNNIAIQKIDYIIINPPYYPKNPANNMEQAWYCGEQFDYFENLFLQLKNYMNQESVLLMSLSQDCNVEKIANIAAKNNFTMHIHLTKMTGWERHFVFKIIQTHF